MCRPSLPQCTLLGNDPKRWSNVAPLQPPEWFRGQALVFRDAVRAASCGNVVEAVDILSTMRSEEMRDWFCEHGQWSGKHRTTILGLFNLPELCEMDLVRSPKKYERAVFERDNYTCRYCGLVVVAKEVLVAFERVVGTPIFRNVGRNAEQHGVVHAFKLVADHVKPFKRGGRTNLDNLVTGCPGCNYGKDHYTVEQLGISDPRDRIPQPSEWDGLTSLLPGLKAHSGTISTISGSTASIGCAIREAPQ